VQQVFDIRTAENSVKANRRDSASKSSDQKPIHGSSERPKSRQTLDGNLGSLKRTLNLPETPDLEAYRAMNIGK
jgi:hypothetical protein